MCEQLAQGRYLVVPRAAIEPGNSESPVRHATITPPSDTGKVYNMKKHHIVIIRAVKALIFNALFNALRTHH